MREDCKNHGSSFCADHECDSCPNLNISLKTQLHTREVFAGSGEEPNVHGYVEFYILDNSSAGDSSLLAAASKWIGVHPEYTLMAITLNHDSAGDVESTTLTLFVEE